MRFSFPSLLIVLVLLPVPLSSIGCGSKSETAASPDELDAYLQANPDIANAEDDPIEAE